MKNIVFVVRFLFGVFFIIAGLNHFFNFFSMPEFSPEAFIFITALESTHYMMPLIAGVQLVAGLMLFINIFTPLAIILLAPIVVNILLFHIFLEPKMLALAIAITLVECFLALVNWDHYSHLFKKS